MMLRLVVPIALAAVVAVTLVRTVPDQVDTPLVSDRLGLKPRSVDLEPAAQQGREITSRLTLRHRAPAQLLVHPEIRLLFATHGESPQLLSGELRQAGAPCRYVTAPRARLADNDYLTFVRGGQCGPVADGTLERFDLEVTTIGASHIAVWTYVAPAGALPEPQLQIASGASPQAGAALLVRGRYVDPGHERAYRRVELLNYVWQIAAGTWWIWMAIALVTGLAVVGAVVYPWMPAERSSPNLLLRAAAGATCFAAALGLLYVVLVPPLQAPDEPDHLLSYAAAIGDARLSGEALVWANLGHFERIKFHADETFRPADVGSPTHEPWASHIFAEDVAARSPTAFAVWMTLARFLRGSSAPRVLLVMRIANALIFALAVGLGTALIILTGSGPYRQLACLPYLLVPTLPFFAMHMSEFGLLTSAYVVLSACIAGLALASERWRWLGFPLGLASALVLASGRSAGPLAPVLAAALVARALVGEPVDTRISQAVRSALVFWGGLALGASSLLLIASPAYQAFLWTTAATQAPPGTEHAVRFVYESAWLLPAAGGVALVGELAAFSLRRWWARGRTRGRSVWVPAAAYALAAGLLALLLVSLFVTLPHLGYLGVPTPPSARQYVSQALATMGTSLRVHDPDLLLVSSFWGGFGWIDTLPSPILISGLVLLSGLAGAALLVHAGRTRNGRQLVWVLVLATGWATSLLLYALTSYAMSRNLHGRYLIGWHLTLLAVAWSSAVVIPPLAPRGQPSGQARFPRTVVLLFVCAAVHAYCLTVILARYF